MKESKEAIVWVDYEGADYLDNTQCPYCNHFFNPKCHYKEYIRKCPGCNKKFKYWACKYVVIKIIKEHT